MENQSSYELMLIGVSANADALFSRAEKYLKDANVLNLKTEKMGKKKLAYQIKKQLEADFFLFNFEAQGESIKSITDKLRLEQDDVLRYMILKLHNKKSKGKKAKTAPKIEEKEEKVAPKVTVVTKSAPKVLETKKVAKATKVSKNKKTGVKKGK